MDLSPMRDNQLVRQQQEHFSRISERYMNARQDGRHLLLKLLIWREFFRRAKLDLPAEPAVLEGMCGIGEGRRILEENLGRKIAWRGFDYSAPMVEGARALHGSNVFQADATEYEPELQYDLVLIIGGLHHVFREADKVVTNLSGAIKPGGYFLCVEPTDGNFIYRRVRQSIYRRNNLFDQETERAFSVGSLHQLFRNAGLVHQLDMNFGLLAYVLYYNPDAFPGLNRGSTKLVRLLWNMDSFLVWNSVGRLLSFATMTLWRKPGNMSMGG